MDDEINPTTVDEYFKALPTFSGADWIRANETWKVGEMSPLGEAVANLLGDLFAGIYHLNYTSLRKVDWTNPRWIVFNLDRHLSTFDSDELTRLVVLCHDRCLRCDLKGKAPGIVELMFHQRHAREGRMYERHPTIETAVARIRSAYHPLPSAAAQS